jgi:hypothetical protein
MKRWMSQFFIPSMVIFKFIKKKLSKFQGKKYTYGTIFFLRMLPQLGFTNADEFNNFLNTL